MDEIRRRRWAYGLLVLLLAGSFAVRAWMASAELGARRFWDERYGLQNVAGFLETGSLAPRNAYHPTLSYLPQALVLRVFHQAAVRGDRPGLEVWRSGPRFTPLGYLVARLIEVLFGTLSIGWLAWLGWRLFDRPTGLLAALLMAAAPWHIRQSSLFKPDVLLVWLTLVAFGWALSAARRPTAGRTLRAGLGVGLALAAKFNGGPAAVPLIVAAASDARRWPRVLLWLVAAGLVAAAVFLLLDPHLLLAPEAVRHDFGHTLEDYRFKGAEHGTGHLDMIAHAAASLLSAPFHGPLLGAVALGGLLWIALRLPRATPARRVELAMLLSYPLAYVLLYALVTTNPSAHNWLMVLPFTSLAAGFALVEGWRWAARRLPALGRPAVAATAVACLALALTGKATAYVYGSAVPTTWRLADGEIADRLAEPTARRLILQQGLASYRFGRWLRRGERPLLLSAALARPGGFDPALTDFEVWAAPDRAALDARVRRATAAPYAEALFVEPSLFHARGPCLLLVYHRWLAVGRPVTLPLAALAAGAGGVDGASPPPPAAERVTLEVEVPRGAPRPVLTWGGRPVPLAGVFDPGPTARFVSPRLPRREGALAVAPGGRRPTRGRVVIQGWRAADGARTGH